MAELFNLLKAKMPAEVRMEVDEQIKQVIIKITLQEKVIDYNQKLYKNKFSIFTTESTENKLSANRLNNNMIDLEKILDKFPCIMRNNKAKIILA